MARRVFICLVLAALTVYVYHDVYRFEFVNFDDPEYVTDNPRVVSGLSWDNIRWAFTSSYAANWIPLTWLSLMLDAGIWGADGAGGFHITNVLLHIASTLVLFLLLEQMTGAAWRSSLVAALFAVHPLHVESVAWVTERKDVLSTLFGLLCITAYCRYAARNSARWYVASLLLYAASLMSKQMFVTMPALLLLLDYWPLERFRRAASARRLMLEKIPFAVLAAVASLIVLVVQQKGGTVQSLVQIPLGMRLSNAAISSIVYLAQMFRPVDLAVFYPFELVTTEAGTSVEVCLFCGVTSAILLAVATLVAFVLGRRWKFALFGWLWYLVTLLPVIGIIQIGSQRMADRYTYVPLIGPFVIVAWLLAGPQSAGPVRKAVASLVAVLSVGVLAFLAHRQASYWENSITLFEHAVAVTGPNATARTNLGLALSNAGRTDDAIAELRSATEIDPNFAIAHNNLGLLLQPREPDVAFAAFATAVELDPGYATAHANLAGMLFERGQVAAAEEKYRRAQFLEPENPTFLIGLAQVLRATERRDEAAFYLETACRVAPQNATAHMELGIVSFELGRTTKGLEHLRRSVELDEASATARQNLGAALFAQGHLDDAIEQFNEALRIKPDFLAAQQGLKAALDAKSKRQPVR